MIVSLVKLMFLYSNHCFEFAVSLLREGVCKDGESTANIMVVGGVRAHSVGLTQPPI
jgi:hypothetical protein